MSATLAIGIGCRRGCAGAAIAALVREATGDRDLAGARLFTIDRKRDEAGMHDAAARLGLPLAFLSAHDLAAVADRVATRSARVEAAMGVPSVAEAAALAGAGPGAVLTMPRIARDGATCAIATTGPARRASSPLAGEVDRPEVGPEGGRAGGTAIARSGLPRTPDPSPRGGGDSETLRRAGSASP